MVEEVLYTGYTTAPSDYNCSDGALAASINLIPEDGALRPILPPYVEFTLQENQNACYIHKVNTQTNYIISTNEGNRLSFSTHKGDTFLTFAEKEKLVDINAIGNILVISSSLHLYYVLFKDAAYILLGTELPKIDISFGLLAEVIGKEHKTKLTFSDYTSAESSWKFYARASFDVDLISNPSPYIKTTYAKGVQIDLSKNLLKNNEYKIQVKGVGFTSIVLHGAKPGSTTYEKLAEVRGEATIRPKDTYASFKIDVFAESFHPSYHASGDIEILSGFEANVVGKVIEYNEKNYNAIAAAINKFVNEQAIQKSRFIYPFFIRYALRLYDGSYARISDPVLLIPNSDYAPFINFDNSDSLRLYAFVADLQYRFENRIEEKWRDIIVGVDVFASPQIYPYNQGKNFDASENLFQYAIKNKESGLDQIKQTNYGYCALGSSSRIGYEGFGKYDLCEKAEAEFGFADTNKKDDWRIVKLAPEQDALVKLQESGSFYLIHSFEFDEIVSTGSDNAAFTTLDIKRGVLSSLTTRQTLSDDVFSNCTFYDAHLTSYNQRLHLFDFHLKHPTPSSPNLINGQQGSGGFGELMHVLVFIRTTQGERVVSYIPEGVEYVSDAQWFYYPHNGAYKAIFLYEVPSGSYDIATLNLKQHKMLNGAYWMADSLSGGISAQAQAESFKLPPDAPASYYPNSVLQSNAIMPFTFPAKLMVTFGVERIIKMASAVKALSQGQFGQFPLYAFTTDGVWALEVSNVGSYSARQPITRDICTNPNGITQLDSAVLFPTDRGIMLLSGSHAQCISESIDAEQSFNVMGLPSFDAIGSSLKECLPILPFSQFLKDCGMVYDYVHQRVIVYSPNTTYAYVYSLKTNQWGMIASSIESHLNAYPEALAVGKNNSVLNFSKIGSTSAQCLYVTRPIKLGAPNIHKTISTIIQRGNFLRGDVGSVLYGSRDLYTWHLVWSSKDNFLRGFRGTPYKYFRIAGIATLSEDKSISGASVNYEPRHTNQIR